MGEVKPFKANLDWALKFDVMQKIIEGAYTFGDRVAKRFSLKSSENNNNHEHQIEIHCLESNEAIAVREKIKKIINEAEYKSWFKSAHIVIQREGEAQLFVSSSFVKDIIRTRYSFVTENLFDEIVVGCPSYNSCNTNKEAQDITTHEIEQSVIDAVPKEQEKQVMDCLNDEEQAHSASSVEAKSLMFKSPSENDCRGLFLEEPNIHVETDDFSTIADEVCSLVDFSREDLLNVSSSKEDIDYFSFDKCVRVNEIQSPEVKKPPEIKIIYISDELGKKNHISEVNSLKSTNNLDDFFIDQPKYYQGIFNSIGKLIYRTSLIKGNERQNSVYSDFFDEHVIPPPKIFMVCLQKNRPKPVPFCLLL